MLFQDDQRLVEFGIALANLFVKDSDLRVLAAQAEYGSTGYVWVMNVACDQTAEIVGIFSGPSAAAFMKQKADAIDILE